jgi:hypothetical protein
MVYSHLKIRLPIFLVEQEQGEEKMKRIVQNQFKEGRYEIAIKRIGKDAPIEINVMGDSETQEILRLIGMLNLRSALAS